MMDRETQEPQETLTQVVGALSELLGRSLRWTGALELTESLFSSGVAHLDGRVEITRAVWNKSSYRCEQSFTRRCIFAHHPIQATNTASIASGKKMLSSRCKDCFGMKCFIG